MGIDHGVAYGLSRAAPLALIFCLAATTPALAATGVETKPAQQCLRDIRQLSANLNKGGDWLDGGDYGYGYPMFGYGYAYGFGYGADLGSPERAARPEGIESKGYWRARPGYEVRTLLAAANIVAEHGEEQACQTLLSMTRDAYTAYKADLKNGTARRGGVPGTRREQIANAQPMSTRNVAYRSDELIGSSVINGQDDSLGRVEDIVVSPETGKIAYLVIGHGGLLGIDEKYAAVPWNDFKSTSGTNLLVLAATKGNLEGAPQIDEDQFGAHGAFSAQSQEVNEYWAVHLSK
jgi:sporulation protein YlmC with PRC-barrel domain